MTPAVYGGKSCLVRGRGEGGAGVGEGNQEATQGTVLALLKKAGNLRRGKVENSQAFVLEQPLLSLLNR